MAGKKIKFVYNKNLDNSISWLLKVTDGDTEYQFNIIASSIDRAILTARERYWESTPDRVKIICIGSCKTLISNEYGPF